MLFLMFCYFVWILLFRADISQFHLALCLFEFCFPFLFPAICCLAEVIFTRNHQNYKCMVKWKIVFKILKIFWSTFKKERWFGRIKHWKAEKNIGEFPRISGLYSLWKHKGTAKWRNGFQPVTFLDVWMGSGYVCRSLKFFFRKDFVKYWFSEKSILFSSLYCWLSIV